MSLHRRFAVQGPLQSKQEKEYTEIMQAGVFSQ